MITAVICTAKGGIQLDNCIQSLLPQKLEQIVVVHSYPVEKKHPHIHYIHTNGYFGYAHAVNIAFTHINKGAIFLLNDDTIVDKNCVSKLTSLSSEHQILQPQICYLDHRTQIENAGHWLWKDGGNIARGRGSFMDRSLPQELLVFSGAGVYLPRRIINTVGAFDSDLFSFGEDLDWSLRSIRLGFSIQYVPKAILWHQLGRSHGRHGYQKGVWVEKNRIQAMIRSFPRSLILKSPISTYQRLSLLAIGSLLHRGSGATDSRNTALGAINGIMIGYRDWWKAYQKRKRDQPNWRLSDEEFLDMLQRNLPPIRDLWHPLSL